MTLEMDLPRQSVTLSYADLIVVNRNKEYAPFDPARIQRAIEKCFEGYEHQCSLTCEQLADAVVAKLAAEFQYSYIVPLEHIQDMVEDVLRREKEVEAWKRYQVYRNERARARSGRPVPAEVKEIFDQASQYFPTAFQQYQYFDKYARFDEDKGRRETWVETVDRTVTELRRLSENRLQQQDYEDIRQSILKLEVMPSMRMLAMAGRGLNPITIYNCSFMPVDSLYAFVEAMIISMAGCGVGFSVEYQFVNKLPFVKKQQKVNMLPQGFMLDGLAEGEGFNPMLETLVTGERDDAGNAYFNVKIADSAEGWAEALYAALQIWFAGYDCQFDYSLIRPAGARLRRKGGRASGPKPLKDALDRIRQIVLSRQGMMLRSIDAHDMMCLVGNAAVSGGVRRTAMISLFDFDDAEMRAAKAPGFEETNPQRWNANNSVVWPEREISQFEILTQFKEMFEYERGEPGIFSREAAVEHMPSRRDRKYWDAQEELFKPIQFGTNPCGEIVLRPWQFCNLSAVVARKDDTQESLARKVRLATIIGTIQSMATDFQHLRPMWRKNCEEERLLGVDITGQLDSPAAQDEAIKSYLVRVARMTNMDYTDILNIPRSASITCVKPSGNTSVLVDCASGLHARFAPFYYRHVRVGIGPMLKVLQDAGVPLFKENGQEELPDAEVTTWVARFPVKAPEGAITRKHWDAINQMEYWLSNKLSWTEHNPSVTISYRPDELFDVVEWVWRNQRAIGGMAFLPVHADSSYRLLPYVEITEEEYEESRRQFPEKVDFSRIYAYEYEDETTASQELACLAGACEVV